MSLAETTTETQMPAPPSDVTQLVWAARQGTTDRARLVYDSADTIVLAFESETAFPGTASERRTHQDATTRWANQNDIPLPETDAYLLLESEFDQNWSLRIAEKYDRPLSMLEYSVNFNDPKWNHYDASISGHADIPGLHGTLRKELKVQGFASHRPEAADTVRTWTTLTHLETGHEFYADVTDSYDVPDAQSYGTYPLVPALLVSVYNTLFAEVADYTELLTGEFTVCERCGVYDESHAEQGVSVMPSIDPNEGWERQYCAECYAHVLHNEYGVLIELARLYVARERGATLVELADEYGESRAHVERMLERLEDAVKRGGDF